MKFINLIKEAGIETELKEDITSGSVIVYHRTGRNGSPVQGIAADGYRVGSRAMYGIGVYTTYDFQSQSNNYMRYQYGNIIIESKVISMKDFLIFDYDIAKKIYGNKNYTLERQLRLILGKDFSLLNEKDIEKLNIELSTFNYSSDVALNFYTEYGNIVSRLRGIVFTGQSDGKVLVSYDRKNVEPIRYTLDEGKTWKNIINKNIYQRLKGYDDDSSNVKDSHILNRIDAKRSLTNDDVNYIIGNERLLSKLDNNGIINLVRFSNERDKIIEIILNNEKVLSNLSGEGINYLIYSSNEPNKIINLILNNERIVSNLNSEGVGLLFKNSKESEKIINVLLNNERFLLNLDSNTISKLFENSKEHEKIINKLLNNEKLISKLDSNSIIYMVRTSNQPEKQIDLLINNDNFVLNMSVDTFDSFFSGNNPEKIFYTVINHNNQKIKQYLPYINNQVLSNLLSDSKDPQKIIDYLLNFDFFMKNTYLENINTFFYFYGLDNIDVLINQLLNNEEFFNNIDKSTIKMIIRYSDYLPNTMKKLGEKGEEFIKNIKHNDITELFYGYLTSPSDLIDLLGDKFTEYITSDYLNDSDLEQLLVGSNDELMKEIFLSNEIFISEIDPRKLQLLFEHISDRQMVMDIILNNESFMSNINKSHLYVMFIYRSKFEKKDDLIGKLIKNDYFLLNMDDDSLNEILKNTSDKNSIINKLMENERFLPNMKERVLSIILVNTSSQFDIIKKMLKYLNESHINAMKISLGFNNRDEIFNYVKKYRPDLFDKNIQENIKRIKRLL